MVQYNPREQTKYGEVIFTGHIEIDRRVQLNSDGELMLGSIACPDRGRRWKLTLPPEAWESKEGFKRRRHCVEVDGCSESPCGEGYRHVFPGSPG